MRVQNNFSARNFTSLFLAFLVFTVKISGQNPTPTPDANEAIRVNTDLIQTTVTVTDKNGRFVDNLTSEHFELRVDGKRVPIEFFERFVSAPKSENAPPPTNNQKNNAVFVNPNLRERKIIFFIDDLHLSPDSLSRTRSTVNYFIENEMMPRDNVLIVSASGQIGFLQQFTDNKAVLRAAIARLKPIPYVVRDTEPPPMTEFVALRIVNGDREAAEFYVEKILEGFNTKGIRGINRQAALEMVKNRANNIVSGLVSVSEASLGSLENLLQSINQIGGRKLIFLASDGFYLGSKKTGVVDSLRLQRAVNMATRSGSTIYTIDARGLFSTSPDASGERPIDPQGRLDRGQIGEDVLSQDTLFTLAEQTGGRFLKNQNYFDRWIDRMLDENSNYYLLAWSPEKDAADNEKFKRIEVGIAGRSDLTVRFQRGYLTGWEKPGAENAGNSKTKKTSNQKQAEKTVTTKPSVKNKILPVKLSLNYLDVPNSGAVLTSSVQVDADELDYAGGAQAAAVDVAGVIFNDQGKQVADFKTGLSVTPRPQEADQSVIYNHRTPLVPGIYQVRIGARESKSGQTGTATEWIEIPDLNKRQLALGSLFLGVKTVQKSGKPEDVQIQFSVDHEFNRPLQLDFMSFIYNASWAANKGINVATKVEIFDASGRVIVDTPMRPLSTKGITDLSRIPFSGTIRQQSSAPGDYLLRVTVTDVSTGKSAVQQTVFTIK